MATQPRPEEGLLVEIDTITGDTLSPSITHLAKILEDLFIESVDDYRYAGRLYHTLANLEVRIGQFFDADIDKAYKLHRSLTAKRKSFLEPVNVFKKRTKFLMAAWDDEQERIRKEKERQIAEAARKQEEARLLAEAAALEREGAVEEAKAVMEEAETVQAPAITVADEVPSVGVSYRWNYSAEVIDKKALAKAVADGLQPPTVIEGAMTVLNQLARALKEEFNVPGCRLKKERV